ncbi:MAG: hypothetical protein K0Q49_1839 [Haloplasmataceae bacterium]|jgi:hypothetical protein|nr:hypothetical protein [Haloplasmataceae bacterium]
MITPQKFNTYNNFVIKSITHILNSGFANVKSIKMMYIST